MDATLNDIYKKIEELNSIKEKKSDDYNAKVAEINSSINSLKEDKINELIKDEYENKKTLLHFAAENGHVNVVNALLENGANVNAEDNDGWTALHLVTANGNVDVVNTLLEKGAGVNAVNNKGITPLHLAAENGLVNVVNTLLDKGANVNAVNNKGITPLHFAAKNGNVDVVNALLKKGAGVNAKNNYKNTPLHWAAANRRDGVVNALLKNRAGVNAVNNKGITPLHLAAENGNVDVVNALLEKGAGVNAVNNKGITPLHLAAENGNVDVVKVLLDKGANIKAKDNYENIPLHWAAANGRDGVVNALLEKGADVNVKNNYGWTALHWAAKNGHVNVVNALLKKGANIKAKDNDGWTALHLAAKNGYTDVVNALLEKGANIEAKDNDGWTALHLATANGNVDIVNTLLEKGANINAVDENGNTPLHFAAENKEIKQILEEKKREEEKKAGDGNEEEKKEEKKAGDGNEEENKEEKKAGDGNEEENKEEKKAEEKLYAIYKKIKELDAINKENLNDYNNKVAEINSSINSLKEDKINELIKDEYENKKTLLHFAAENGHVNVVNALLENGANVNAEDNDGWTALHLATANGNVDIVNTLLEKGANIEAKNNNGETALHLATANGHVDIVNTLLEKGANIEAKDNNGWTALHWAVEHGHVNVVNALLEKGADINAVDENGNTPLHFAAENKEIKQILEEEEKRRKNAEEEISLIMIEENIKELNEKGEECYENFMNNIYNFFNSKKEIDLENIKKILYNIIKYYYVNKYNKNLFRGALDNFLRNANEENGKEKSIDDEFLKNILNEIHSENIANIYENLEEKYENNYLKEQIEDSINNIFEKHILNKKELNQKIENFIALKQQIENLTQKDISPNAKSTLIESLQGTNFIDFTFAFPILKNKFNFVNSKENYFNDNNGCTFACFNPNKVMPNGYKIAIKNDNNSHYTACILNNKNEVVCELNSQNIGTQNDNCCLIHAIENALILKNIAKCYKDKKITKPLIENFTEQAIEQAKKAKINEKNLFQKVDSNKLKEQRDLLLKISLLDSLVDVDNSEKGPKKELDEAITNFMNYCENYNRFNDKSQEIFSEILEKNRKLSISEPTAQLNINEEVKNNINIFDLIKTGSIEDIKTAINSDPNLLLSKNKYGETPLIYALIREKDNDKSKKIVEFILNILKKNENKELAKKVINTTNNSGKTTLSCAITTENAFWDYNTVKLLLEAGADPAQPNADGYIPIAIANNVKRHDVVELLQKEYGQQLPTSQQLEKFRPQTEYYTPQQQSQQGIPEQTRPQQFFRQSPQTYQGQNTNNLPNNGAEHQYQPKPTLEETNSQTQDPQNLEPSKNNTKKTSGEQNPILPDPTPAKENRDNQDIPKSATFAKNSGWLDDGMAQVATAMIKSVVKPLRRTFPFVGSASKAFGVKFDDKEIIKSINQIIKDAENGIEIDNDRIEAEENNFILKGKKNAIRIAGILINLFGPTVLNKIMHSEKNGNSAEALKKIIEALSIQSILQNYKNGNRKIDATHAIVKKVPNILIKNKELIERWQIHMLEQVKNNNCEKLEMINDRDNKLLALKKAQNLENEYSNYIKNRDEELEQFENEIENKNQEFEEYKKQLKARQKDLEQTQEELEKNTFGNLNRLIDA